MSLFDLTPRGTGAYGRPNRDEDEVNASEALPARLLPISNRRVHVRRHNDLVA